MAKKALRVSVPILCLVFGCALAPGFAFGQNRVDSKEALAHVVTRVDPERPRAAVEAKVGGKVYADVIVRTDGRVESVEILAGAEMLRAPTAAALKQWTFKPFLEGNRPARIITLIEVPFPDPIRDEEQRIYESYRSTEYKCRRELESSPRTAPATCEEAVRAASQLPPERRLERSEVYTLHGQSFLVNRRFEEALKAFEQALAFRRGDAGPDDEGMASLFEIVAVTHVAKGDSRKADEAFAAAVKSYEGAIARTRTLQQAYTTRLRATLLRYSDYKRAIGEPLAADALKAKADALPKPTPPVDNVSAMRVIDGVRCMGPYVAYFTGDDIRQIRALMPKGAPPLWLIMSLGQYSNNAWRIDAYLEPDRTISGVRLGRVAGLSAALPAKDVLTGAKSWKQDVRITAYAQTPLAGSDPRDVASERHPNRPALITPMGDLAMLTDEEIMSVLTFVRSSAVKSSSAPRLSTDVQPWVISDITKWSSGEVHVYLVEPLGRRTQLIRLVRNGVSWTIRELR
jgi:tetratricopeptide (TPR) repeat protein